MEWRDRRGRADADSEEIIEIGNMFSIDIMSEKYVNWYKEVMA